jgi:TRAP transporter TAXI family solute receptor
MASEFKLALPGIDVRSVQPSGLTLDAITAGSIDWGVERSDLAYAAYRDGTIPPERQIRGVALLQPLPLYVIVAAGSGIETLADLDGASIATGPENTSSWTLGMALLKAWAIGNAVITPLTSRAVASAGLKDGTFDAVFMPGYVYPDDTVYSAIREGAYLIPVDGPAVDQVRRDNPFVRVISIPRNIYPGQDRLIPTIGFELVVICRAGLDEQLVHDATRQLFQVYPRLSTVEASLRFLDFDRAPATPVPLHPGAERYFQELQLSR